MKFVTKPVVIEAVQLQASRPRQKGEPFNERPAWLEVALASGVVCLRKVDFENAWRALIVTPDSQQVARPGDWILHGTKAGDIYVCPADVFPSIYEPVTE